MGKPSEIPEDIWEAALAYADELHESDDYMHLESCKVLARAIKAERHACAERFRYAPGSDPRYHPYIMGTA